MRAAALAIRESRARGLSCHNSAKLASDLFGSEASETLVASAWVSAVILYDKVYDRVAKQLGEDVALLAANLTA